MDACRICPRHLAGAVAPDEHSHGEQQVSCPSLHSPARSQQRERGREQARSLRLASECKKAHKQETQKGQSSRISFWKLAWQDSIPCRDLTCHVTFVPNLALANRHSCSLQVQFSSFMRFGIFGQARCESLVRRAWQSEDHAYHASSQLVSLRVIIAVPHRRLMVCWPGCMHLYFRTNMP